MLHEYTSYLLLSDITLLDAWAWEVAEAFPGVPVMQVGSSMERADYHDVDVRLMPDEEQWRALAVIDVRRLALPLSLWGQRATGLPIDCQVQEPLRTHAERERPRRMLARSTLVG